MFDFPTMIIQFAWLVLPIFTFIISLKAKQQLPGQGSSLMVAGSVLLMLSAIANTAIQYSMSLGDFDMDSIGSYYIITGIASAIGQILFLGGLYQLIEAIGKAKDGKDLLDYLPD